MFLVFLFILGTCVGSFLNVLADRLPNNKNPFKGRSYCDHCKKTLKWYDMIPLLSFFLLKVRCRYCKVKLSFYYPFIEVVTGAMFVCIYLLVIHQIPQINSQLSAISFLAYYLFIASSLIVVFFADLKYGIIPDSIILVSVFVSLGYFLIFNPSLLLINLVSALGSFLFLLLLHIVTKGKGMGLGDVKFAVLMGLFLGFPNIIAAFYLAFLTGAIVGIILIIWKKKKLRTDTLPFGPFLVFGTLISLFWGEKIMQIAWNGILIH